VKRIIIAVFLCLSAFIGAQTQADQRLIEFSPSEVTLDSMRFDSGDRQIEFSFRNMTTRKVTILEVRSQCGCLTGEVKSREVRAGGNGVLTATFSPASLHGPQSRHLTIVSTDGEKTMLSSLTVKTFVVRDESEGEIRYPEDLGMGLRTDYLKNLVKVDKMGDHACSIALYNDTDEQISIELKSGRNVKIYCPKTIPPRSRVNANIIVKPGLFESGVFSKEIKIKVCGKEVTPLEIHGLFN